MYRVILRDWAPVPFAWVEDQREIPDDGFAPMKKDKFVRRNITRREKAEQVARDAAYAAILKKGLDFGYDEERGLYEVYVGGELVCTSVDPCHACRLVHYCSLNQEGDSCSILS